MEGFTKAPNPQDKEKRPILLEILLALTICLVIGIGIYMILNPHKGEEEERNSERSQAVVDIASAVKEYVDLTGNIPREIPLNRECASIGNEICKLNATDCVGYVQLESLTETGLLTQIPEDSLRVSASGTGYYISQDGDGNVLVCSPFAERGSEISLKQFVY